MLERDADLALLTAAVDRLRLAEGGVVLVSGEAGIGKSTLLDAFVRAVADDTRVLRGWCDDLVTANPLGPIREAVRGRPGSLPVTPELDAALAEGDVATALDSLVTIFGRTRTVLVVEDLHWADDATLDVLGYLARRIDQLRLLLVCSLRPGESTSPALRRLLGGLPPRDTVRIELKPLSRAAVARLNAATRWDTDELLQVTGGNPFYVTEALAAAPDQGVPPTVSDAVLSRLHRSSRTCRRALEKLSVWAGELPHELAEAMLGDDIEGLEEAETLGLISVDADGIRFRHELARRATEGTLTLVRRRAIDRHVVEVLRARSQDIPRLLHHAIRSGDAETVARYAPEAGDYSARVGANRQAIEYFAAALEHEDLLNRRDLATVSDSYAWALHIAHRSHDAVAQGRRAAGLWAELGDTDAEAASLRRLARELLMAGEPEEALACAELAVRLTMASDAEARAASLGALGAHYTIIGDQRGVALLRESRSLVGRGALPGTDSLCLNYLAYAVADMSPDERLATLRESLASAQQEQAFEAEARAWTNLVEIQYRYRRMDDLRDSVAAGLAFVRRHAYWSHAYNLEIHRALALQHQGDWDTARTEFETALARYPDPGMLLTTPCRRTAGCWPDLVTPAPSSCCGVLGSWRCGFGCCAGCRSLVQGWPNGLG